MKSEYKRIAAQTGHSPEFAAAIEEILKSVADWTPESREAYTRGFYRALKLAADFSPSDRL